MTVERIKPRTNAWVESLASHAERYRHFIDELQGLDVLDAACGVGYGTLMIAESGASSVTGIDLSQEALDIANEEFSHENIRFVNANCTSLPFDDDQFDAATSFETIEHLAEPEKFIDELHRVIKPGGKLFLSCPNSLTHSLSTVRKTDNPWHLSEMTLAELRQRVSLRFDIESTWHQTPSLEQIMAQHVENLNLCIDRSLVIKAENILRSLLSKDRVKPILTIPSLNSVINASSEPIRRLETNDPVWPAEASVFLLSCSAKSA